MRRLATVAAVAAAMTATPAAAYENLIRFAAIFPDGIERPYVFDYAAPLGGFTPRGPAPGDRQIGIALASGALDPLTGVDFARVSAVLSVGDPPSTITVLVGEDGFASGAPAALLARGFAGTEVDGIPVFARGADHAISLADAADPDPFASGMGKAQRLALGDDYLVRTAGWPELNTALAALPRPSNDANLWAAMVEGLRASAGYDSHLDQASGWTVSAFFDPGPGIDLLSDPALVWKSRSKITTAAPSEPVVFPFALLAVTQYEGAASLSIVLPFDDDMRAQRAGEVIAQRLAEHPLTPAEPVVDVQYMEPYSIAVIGLDLADPAQAYRLYAAWIGDIHQRRFLPLMLDP